MHISSGRTDYVSLVLASSPAQGDRVVPRVVHIDYHATGKRAQSLTLYTHPQATYANIMERVAMETNADYFDTLSVTKRRELAHKEGFIAQLSREALLRFTTSLTVVGDT